MEKAHLSLRSSGRAGLWVWLCIPLSGSRELGVPSREVEEPDEREADSTVGLLFSVAEDLRGWFFAFFAGTGSGQVH